MHSLLCLLYGFFIFLSGYGLGSVLIKKNILSILPEKKNYIREFVIISSLGVGFLSLIHFIFGCLRGFKEPFIYILISLILIFGIYGLFDIIKSFISYIKSKPQKLSKPNFIAMVMLSVMVLGLIFTLINALSPSISDDWDSLAYHLAAPKKYLEHGGFYYIDYSSHTNFPMFQEVLYITPIFFKIPQVAKIIHFIFGVFTCVLVGFSLKDFFIKGKDRYSTIFGAYLVFSMPIVLWLMTTAYIDITFAFYGLLALYFALLYNENKHSLSLIFCGIACGFGASCKMLGLQYILIFALWIFLYNLFFKAKFKDIFKPLCIFIGVSVIVCACWYIRSFIWTGNPVYPFFYSIFHGKDWSVELADFYASNQAKFGVGHSLKSFITTPIWMTIDHSSFYDVPGLYVGIVLLITFPSMCLLWQVRKKNLLLTAISICLLYIIWFFLTHQSRYLIPMFVMSSVFIPAILSYIKGGYLVKYSLIVIIIAVSFIGLFQMYSTMLVRWPVVSGEISQKMYLSRYFKPYYATMFINNNLPQDVKIGLFGDTEGFYLDRDYVWCDYGHNSLLSHNYNTAPALIEDLKSLGITYILVPFGKNPPTIGDREFAKATNKILYEAIDLGLMKCVYPDNMSSGRVFVYKLN
ncbi:MAG: hypothetical protein IJS60_06505 [Abditibacteriota bacterium]|nr:hypothetical protein [Abditibacteriota bacterium]